MKPLAKDKIEVSQALLSDMLELHRLTELQATMLARVMLGSAGNIAADLVEVSAQVDVVRSRIQQDHMQERWALSLLLDSISLGKNPRTTASSKPPLKP